MKSPGYYYILLSVFLAPCFIDNFPAAGCRLLALKALCEARLDRDLHDAVEDAIKPLRLPKPSRNAPPPARGSKAPPPPRTLDDFRMKPLGKDSSGFVFYWLDMGPAGEGSSPRFLYTLNHLIFADQLGA
jgi:hypothetical protein